MLISDKPILNYRKGGKLLTQNNFGNELNCLMKRLPGEPKYGAFNHSGDAADEESDDEVYAEESDESVPSEVWNDDLDDDANEIAPTAGEGSDETDDDSVGDTGEVSEETEGKESDENPKYRPTGSMMNLTSASEQDDDSASEPDGDSSPKPDNSSDDNYTPEDDSSESSVGDMEGGTSSAEGDISDYEGMPSDTKKRKILAFHPEDQRRIAFRR